MSLFDNLLVKIPEIQAAYSNNCKDVLKKYLAVLDNFAEENRIGKQKSKIALLNNKNGLTSDLHSINEDDVETARAPEPRNNTRRPSKTSKSREPSAMGKRNVVNKAALPIEAQPYTEVTISNVVAPEPQVADPQTKRLSRKRIKDEIDSTSSPEQDRRPKRNASVRAQGVISKQVNVNLTTKLRREEPSLKPDDHRSKGNNSDENDKENNAPLIQVKQEKLSVAPEESTDKERLPVDVKVKHELGRDDLAMPPPSFPPIPNPRGRAAKAKKEKGIEREQSMSEESGRRSRSSRRKQTDTIMGPPPVPSGRLTRASSRSNSIVTSSEDMPPPPPPQEARPKRTRAKKKPSMSSESENSTAPAPENNSGTPEKPRPKRTRRGKAAQKEEVQKEITTDKGEKEKKAEESDKLEEIKKSKEPRTSKGPVTIVANGGTVSPIVNMVKGTKSKAKSKIKKQAAREDSVPEAINSTVEQVHLDETRVIAVDPDMTISTGPLDRSVLLTNGTYHHGSTSTRHPNMNETVVIDKHADCRETMLVDKQPSTFMNCTVVLDKAGQAVNMTEDNSMLTDDNSEHEVSPPRSRIPVVQPTSAVKEKVQQFEELALRVTRTKTRALTKQESTDNHTPPDKMIKPVLSADTLNKMSNLIFNGKTQIPQVSSSASKPRENVVSNVKSFLPTSASTSKMTSLAQQREAAEVLKKEREDARKKKEAILEAKREAQRRKREDKMAAAAAAREAAERQRQLALEAVAKERMEKQAHADQGKLERLKEAERKKLELAKKVAETEERRRAEEKARQQRLWEEQRRASLARTKQCEEKELTKKEAVIMAKEIEKRQKEYIEKQKKKQRKDNKMPTPHKTHLYSSQGRVYMQDGFEQLHSDEDDDRPTLPSPPWCASKERQRMLRIMSHIKPSLIDQWFPMQRHTPDLRAIFPNVDRRALKRTSSAVWRTPPNKRLDTVAE